MLVVGEGMVGGVAGIPGILQLIGVEGTPIRVGDDAELRVVK